MFKQFRKQMAQLKVTIFAVARMSWEEYFWGDREAERYSLPIK